MTPYNDRIKQGHYGPPIATTRSTDLGAPAAKAKPATTKKAKRQ